MRPGYVLVLLGIGLGLAMAPAAWAAGSVPPPPLAEARGDLDGDGQPERVRLDRDGSLRVESADGRPRGELRLPLPGDHGPATLGVRDVEEHALVQARVQLGRGQAFEAVALLGRAGLTPLFVGRTGPSGDGERVDHLRVDEAGVVRYQTSPGMTRCDGEEQLFAERWDFERERFRPVIVEPPLGRTLATTATLPPFAAAPPLGLYRFVAASTAPEAERHADRLAAPRELEDGSVRSAWIAGGPGGGRGAWVTARAEGVSSRVRGLRLVGGAVTPRLVTLLVGTGSEAQAFTVALPGGEPRWLALPTPVAAGCLALVIAEPAPGHDNGLAEVAIYTELDGEGSLDRLAARVAGDGADADGAAHLLAARGAPAARAVVAALPGAVGSGRRRLLDLLAGFDLPDEAPRLAPALGRALETAEAAQQPALAAALARLGPAGTREAARLYGDEAQAESTRAAAATTLGSRAAAGDGEARALLLGGAGRGTPPLRAATAEALGRAAAADAASAAATAEALAAVAGDATGDAARGDLARALAHALGHAPSGLREQAARALDGAWRAVPADAARFAVRLRLLRAMAELGHPSLAPAARAAAGDGDELVRAAAVTAAAELGDGAPALGALGDRDAGVRRAAAAALGAHPELGEAGGGTQALGSALGRDAWPMVRREAAEALGALCAAHHAAPAPALVRAVVGDDAALHGADADEAARRTALAALGRCPGSPPELFTRALAARGQPIAVRELAAALVARRGGPQAAATLAAALADVLADPGADERAAALAVAIARALGRLGDRATPVLEALNAAAQEPSSPEVRKAGLEAVGHLCPPGAARAFERGARDPDGGVARVARAAAESCRR